jgi:hypothetical protein
VDVHKDKVVKEEVDKVVVETEDVVVVEVVETGEIAEDNLQNTKKTN